MQVEKVPELSVVIASVNGRPYIDACLEALHQQEGKVCVEIIIVDCVGLSVTGFIDGAYSQVRLIAYEEQQSVARLRAAGIKRAKGRIIAITEDHCIPAKNWFQMIIQAHQVFDFPAIGGAVDNGAANSLVDWAAFFCEYSNYISPVPQGVVHDLPGPNVSYKREALEGAGELLAEGYRETFLHQHFEAQGLTLWSEPGLVVWHKKHFTVGGFLKERFHYGRWFAGMRGSQVGPLKRLFYLVFSPALPFLLAVRLGRRVLSRGRHFRPFVLSFPLLFVFLITWALGEGLGYAFGPGNSEDELS
jgi:glycosyltransferase involved in cell wall biosynthesis